MAISDDDVAEVSADFGIAPEADAEPEPVAAPEDEAGTGS